MKIGLNIMADKKYISEIKELMQEWDYEANKDLDPTKLTVGSHVKVWWKCSKCNHRWQTEIKTRALSKHGCSACLGKILVVGKNDLLTVRPDIAAQWHPFKNGKLKPQDVSYGWGKKVWWQCKKCGYEWQVSPNSRTNKKCYGACPCCTNKVVVTGKNDLETTYPELAKEWHPVKNGELTPKDVTGGSHKKVWWKCPHGHEYMTAILYRTRGTNCPICNIGRKTSFSEQAFYYYIKQAFPDAINQYKADFLGLMELDIFVPSIKCAIEYDGKPWHGKGFKSKREREKRKYDLCVKNNIELIRIREENVDDSDIADYQYEVSNLSRKHHLDETIKSVLKHLSDKQSIHVNNVNVDTERDRFIILGMMNVVKKENSFAEKYPEIAKEWHPTKNENITPYMFMPGSKVKVWWICPKCGFEYESAINHRTSRKTGCPKCGIEKVAQARRKSINMIEPKTNEIIRTFKSLAEAAQETGLSHGNIGMACAGSRKTTGGYKWQYVDKISETKNNLAKDVYMIDSHTNKIIKKFASVRDAAKETNIYEGSIRKVCKGNRQLAGGYLWRFENEFDVKNANKDKNQLELELN